MSLHACCSGSRPACALGMQPLACRYMFRSPPCCHTQRQMARHHYVCMMTAPCVRGCLVAKNGCEACGVEGGCTPREFTECGCAFHARADERLLNRVLRRAVGTPNFMASFK